MNCEHCGTEHDPNEACALTEQALESLTRQLAENPGLWKQELGE